MAQSLSRRMRRIELGLKNPSPNSTKIHKNTPAGKEGERGFRKNRFQK